MRIFLVRHGQSIGNVDKTAYVKNHDHELVLTDKGLQDAWDAGNKIKKLITDPVHHLDIHRSAYVRATQTSNVVSNNLQSNYQCNIFTPTPLIREREWGKLRDIALAGDKNDDHFGFYHRPDGGESYADVYQRAAIFHQTLKGRDNVVVAHAEFNKVYAMFLLGWTVDEFEQCANQHNGEVWLIENGNYPRFSIFFLWLQSAQIFPPNY